MKNFHPVHIALPVALAFTMLQYGCKKNDSVTNPGQGVTLYFVTATVLAPGVSLNRVRSSC